MHTHTVGRSSRLSWAGSEASRVQSELHSNLALRKQNWTLGSEWCDACAMRSNNPKGVAMRLYCLGIYEDKKGLEDCQEAFYCKTASAVAPQNKDKARLFFFFFFND